MDQRSEMQTKVFFLNAPLPKAWEADRAWDHARYPLQLFADGDLKEMSLRGHAGVFANLGDIAHEISLAAYLDTQDRPSEEDVP